MCATSEARLCTSHRVTPADLAAIRASLDGTTRQSKKACFSQIRAPAPQVALGGSHWTLLVAHRSDLGAPFNFLHLDSAGGGTAGLSFRAATRLAKVIAKAAGRDPKTAIAAPLAHMPRQARLLPAAQCSLNSHSGVTLAPEGSPTPIVHR